MSPLRWDVLLTGFVLALPVLALGVRGDLTADEVTTRLLWCLGAGWGAVALLRLAITPPKTARPKPRVPARFAEPAEDGEPAPAA